MPIGAPPAVAAIILQITAPPANGFPANGADAATKWADVADALFMGVIPPSTTAAAGRAAFIGILSAVDGTAGNGIALLTAAFTAYAATLSGGMSPLYVGSPPAAPCPIPTILTAPVQDATAIANVLAAGLQAWAITGTATLVAPPFTASVWA